LQVLRADRRDQRDDQQHVHEIERGRSSHALARTSPRRAR
jgi:hypothetical protein